MCSITSFSYITPASQLGPLPEFLTTSENIRFKCFNQERLSIQTVCQILKPDLTSDIPTFHVFQENEAFMKFLKDEEFFLTLGLQLPNSDFQIQSNLNLCSDQNDVNQIERLKSVECSENSNNFFQALNGSLIDLGAVINEMMEHETRCFENHDLTQSPTIESAEPIIVQNSEIELILPVLFGIIILAFCSVFLLFSIMRKDREVDNKNREEEIKKLKEVVENMKDFSFKFSDNLSISDTKTIGLSLSNFDENNLSYQEKLTLNTVRSMKTTFSNSKIFLNKKLMIIKNKFISDIEKEDVSSIIRSFVESIKIEDKIIKVEENNETLSYYLQQEEEPIISLDDYIERLVLNINESFTNQRPFETGIRVLCFTKLYYDRFVRKDIFHANKGNIHAFVSLAMLIALKYSEDGTIPNVWWSEVAGFDYDQINDLESMFCVQVNFEFTITLIELEQVLEEFGLTTVPSTSHRKAYTAELVSFSDMSL